MQNRLWNSTLLAVLSFISSCDGADPSPQKSSVDATTRKYPTSCNVAPHPLKGKADGIDHHAIVFVARLSADEHLTLNEEQTSLPQLLRQAQRYSELLPSPYLILEIQSSTPCTAVTHLRLALASTELCKRGNCAEGQNWRAWPMRISPRGVVAPAIGGGHQKAETSGRVINVR